MGTIKLHQNLSEVSEGKCRGPFSPFRTKVAFKNPS